jgi:16S rRNA (cytosine967-C5)-methyltransferase
MIAPARLAAYSVLRAVSAGRANLPGALVEARRNLSDERDRALAGEIATGTLRWQGAFDRVISAYAGRPLSRLDPEVVDILRLTIFQLLHLDRVPASAAVNDAVDLVRKAGKRSAAPLVNAVLRRTSRERGHLPLPLRATGDPDAEIEYLSGALSHPRWLAARWRARYGFAHAEAWCRFDNEPAALTLRANRLLITREDLAGRLAREGVIARATRFAPDGLEIEQGNPLLTPLAGTGLFMVQDEASQLVGVAAAAPPGGRVLDACAAPGGKTITMAADMQGRGLLVAADVRPARVRLLASLVALSGSPLIRIVQANAAEPLPFRDGAFDCVLVDAPCSGLGTLRRDPDIKWRRTEEELPRLAALQLRILRHAARATAPGGRLIYATCSSEPEENEDVVAGFLAESPAFGAAALALPQAPDLINSAGHLRTYPFRDRLEGFFAAAVVKARQVR